MSNRGNGLAAALAVLFVVLGGVGFAAYKRSKQTRGVSSGLAAMPRELYAVAGIDLAALRARPAVMRWYRSVQRTPEVQNLLTESTRACGFELVDRVEVLTIGWDRGALMQPRNGLLAHAQLRARAGELTRCVRGLLTRAGVGPVVQQQSAGHPVLMIPTDTPPNSNSTPVSTSTSYRPDLLFAPLDNQLYVGASTPTLRGLSVYNRSALSAATEPHFASMLRAFGPDVWIYEIVDFKSMRDAEPVTYAIAAGIASLGLPWAGQFAQADTQGFALGPDRDGVRVTTLFRFATSAEANSATAMFTQWLTTTRPLIATQLQHLSQEWSSGVQRRLATTPALGAHLTTIPRALQLGMHMLLRVSVRADDTIVRVELTMTPAELQQIETASSAVQQFLLAPAPPPQSNP